MKIRRPILMGALIGIFLGLLFYSIKNIRLHQAMEHLQNVLK